MKKKTVVAAIMLSAFLISTVSLLNSNCSVSATTGDFWTQKAPMLSARTGFGLAVVGLKIYAIGGTVGGSNYHWLASNEEYDTAADHWIEKAPMPTARAGFGIASYQGKIYAIGGVKGWNANLSEFIPSDANEVYDPSTNTWETKTPLPSPRQRISASVVNGKIYLVGGGTTVDVYDPETDVWSTKTSSFESGFFTCSTVLENKIYVFTGDQPFLQIYDTEANTWKRTQRFTQTLSSAAIASTTGTMASKKIYVVGGQIAHTFDLTRANRIYDSKSDNWTFGSALPTARAGMIAAVVNDKIYLIGGTQNLMAGPTEYLRETLQYTPIDYGTSDFPAQTSSPTPSLPSNSPSPTLTQTPSPEPSPTVPEFPAWVTLPLAVLTVAVTILAVRRKDSFRPLRARCKHTLVICCSLCGTGLFFRES